jgi:hypothetical protein
MAITALALLRFSHAQLASAPAVRVDALDDGVLVHTGESFAAEPAELSLALHQQLGELLALHQDERGILFIPDVAKPSARSSEAVVDEVGEGGVWGPLVSELDGEGEGDFGALLGNLLGQMPGSLLAAANAAAQGQPGAFEQVSSQLSQLMGSSKELQGLAAQFAGMLGNQGGAQAGGPEQDVLGDVAKMAQQLGASGLDLSPTALDELAKRFEAEAPDALTEEPTKPGKPGSKK